MRKLHDGTYRTKAFITHILSYTWYFLMLSEVSVLILSLYKFIMMVLLYGLPIRHTICFIAKAGHSFRHIDTWLQFSHRRQATRYAPFQYFIVSSFTKHCATSTATLYSLMNIHRTQQGVSWHWFRIQTFVKYTLRINILPRSKSIDATLLAAWYHTLNKITLLHYYRHIRKA